MKVTNKKYFIIKLLKLLQDGTLKAGLNELKWIVPTYLNVLLSILCLGFGGCRLFLLVIRSWKALFLVQYCIRYFETKLFKQAKTEIHLSSFLVQAKFNHVEERGRLLKFTFEE